MARGAEVDRRDPPETVSGYGIEETSEIRAVRPCGHRAPQGVPVEWNSRPAATGQA